MGTSPHAGNRCNLRTNLPSPGCSQYLWPILANADFYSCHFHFRVCTCWAWCAWRSLWPRGSWGSCRPHNIASRNAGYSWDARWPLWPGRTRGTRGAWYRSLFPYKYTFRKTSNHFHLWSILYIDRSFSQQRLRILNNHAELSVTFFPLFPFFPSIWFCNKTENGVIKPEMLEHNDQIRSNLQYTALLLLGILSRFGRSALRTLSVQVCQSVVSFSVLICTCGFTSSAWTSALSTHKQWNWRRSLERYFILPKSLSLN